jgi:hypothetical protein
MSDKDHPVADTVESLRQKNECLQELVDIRDLRARTAENSANSLAMSVISLTKIVTDLKQIVMDLNQKLTLAEERARLYESTVVLQDERIDQHGNSVNDEATLSQEDAQ